MSQYKRTCFEKSQNIIDEEVGIGIFNMESCDDEISKVALLHNTKDRCDNDEDIRENIDEMIAEETDEKSIEFRTSLQSTFSSWLVG